MTTVRDVLKGAFRLISGDDQTFSAQDYANAMQALNGMLQSWTTDGLGVWTINRTVLPLTIGVQTYTLGTGGTLNMARPTWIETLSVLITTSTPNVELPIQMLQDEDWQAIPIKAVSSTFPTSCYPQGDFPLNTLNFWPIPAASCSVVIYSPGPFGGFTSLDDLFQMPNGYERATRFCLACELAPEYGLEVAPAVRNTAGIAKNQLRARNYQGVALHCDSALTKNRQGDIFYRSYGFVAP